MKIMTPPANARETVVAKTKYEFDLVKQMRNNTIVKYYEFNEKAFVTKRNGE